MAEAGDLLVHVRQRLDALASPAPSLLPPPGPSSSSSFLFLPSLSISCTPPPILYPPAHPTFHQSTGLTAFYARLVLLLGINGLLTTLPPVLNASSAASPPALPLFGLYTVGSAMGSLFFGLYGDVYGRKPALLAASGLGVLVNAVTAALGTDTALYGHIGRFVAGLSGGAPWPLVTAVALECTPTRTRGRLTLWIIAVASVGGGLGGVLYGIMRGEEEKDERERVTSGVLSVMTLLLLIVLYVMLDESPKYWASVGRTTEAMRVVRKIETAHGMDRQARVTVPTSLYEPPSRRVARGGDRCLDDDFETTGQQEEEEEGELYEYAGPGAAKARNESQCVSTRRISSQCPLQVEVWTPSADFSARQSDARRHHYCVVETFCGAVFCRFTALFTGALAVRTLAMWFYWFVQLLSFSAALVTIVSMASTFIRVNQVDTGLCLEDQVVWAAIALPGLLLAAILIETIGRRGALALFVCCESAVFVVSALLLEEDGDWTNLSLAVGAIVFTTGGTLGALIVFTGEQFPLFIRAVGFSCASAWGHLGTFTGLYLVLYRRMGHEAWSWYDQRVLLAMCGAVSLVLLPVILLMGPETRGRDIDVSWFESSEALQALAGGVLSVTTSGRIEQPAPRYRGLDQDSSDQGNKDVDKRAKVSAGNNEKPPYSPVGRGSMNGMTMAAQALCSPVMYSPVYTASAVAQSRADRGSSVCASSPMSKLWQTHSVRHLGRKKTNRAPRVVARLSDKQQVAYMSSDVKVQAPNKSSGARRVNDRNLNINGLCDASLPVDDLDQLDSMIVEHEDCQPRREPMLNPVLLEWRRSQSSSPSRSRRYLRSKVSRQEDNDFEDIAASVGSTEMGRYTIDLDMFDTFTYISTPVLGGDNYSDYEQRESSSLSCVKNS